MIVTTLSRTIRTNVELDKLYNTNCIIQETWFISDLHFSLAFQITCFKNVVLNFNSLKMRSDCKADSIALKNSYLSNFDIFNQILIFYSI